MLITTKTDTGELKGQLKGKASWREDNTLLQANREERELSRLDRVHPGSQQSAQRPQSSAYALTAKPVSFLPSWIVFSWSYA